jgi:hypothetical protein
LPHYFKYEAHYIDLSGKVYEILFSDKLDRVVLLAISISAGIAVIPPRSGGVQTTGR